MYKAKVNTKVENNVNLAGNNTFEIKGNEYSIERFIDEPDLLQISNGKDQYKARVVKVDRINKTFHIRLNGVRHIIQIKDRFDILLDELGFSSRGNAAMIQIKAPMPGLILEVNVKPGDTVQKGDKVLVLEAMKMENVIKSPGEGKVSEVRVVKGDSVEKNQVLVQF